MNAWEQILRHLQHRLSPESYRNWLEPTRFSHIAGRSLYVMVPNKAAGDWLENVYRPQILEAAQELAMDFESVVFLAPEGGSGASTDGHLNGASATQGRLDFDSADATFNPKYTFDNFVVGSCNQLAHAAARAVATHPSRMYNPLYLYAGVGMGKTHLMQAIGREMKVMYPQIKVIYVQAERFTNEMINSLRFDRMTSFQGRYRSADALLVDDVEVLGNKERTQEEFFHTFNVLYEMGKQIVISSDCPPNDIPGLVDRLRSRFAWGLIVDIQPPDLETKMAILDRRAAEERVHLPEDVRAFLATKLKSNIRELEGCLIRLIAQSSLTGAPITLPMAQQALRSFITPTNKRVSIEMVIKAVTEEFNLRPGQLKDRTNARSITYPRQIAMYLCKELVGASLPEIGHAFAGKHHTTVLHSVKKIESLRRTNSDLNRLLNKIIDTFN